MTVDGQIPIEIYYRTLTHEMTQLSPCSRFNTCNILSPASPICIKSSWRLPGISLPIMLSIVGIQSAWCIYLKWDKCQDLRGGSPNMIFWWHAKKIARFVMALICFHRCKYTKILKLRLLLGVWFPISTFAFPCFTLTPSADLNTRSYTNKKTLAGKVTILWQTCRPQALEAILTYFT